MTWFVGWNRPGELPDVDPQKFDTWPDAFRFLREELGRQFLGRVDEQGGIGEFGSAGSRLLMQRYTDVSIEFRHAKPEHPFTAFYDGEVWWLADL